MTRPDRKANRALLLVLSLWLGGCVRSVSESDPVSDDGVRSSEGVRVVATDSARGVICYGSSVYAGISISCVKVRP